ncbi:MAG TPA: TolC family protein [Kofleriaceae bacterium]|nr:TolC family protein [Kofleriaceae bacterium]
MRAEPAPALRTLLAQPGELAAWLRDRDPLIDAQRARVDAARATARQTRALPNPQLNLGASDLVIGQTNANSGGPGSENPPLSLGKTLIFTAGIDQLIELGKRGPRQNAADLRVRAAGETAAGTLGARIGEATQALGKLAYVAARRGVVATNLAAAEKLMASEKLRLEHSDLSALEFERIELDTQAVALQLARAESDVAAAIAACAAMLYTTCSTDGLDDAALDAGAPLPGAEPAAQAAAQAAIEARPVRVAGRLEIEALGWDAALAHNRRIPDPTIGVGYTLDNLTISGDQHQSLMFTLGIPLPVFDRGDHDEAAARATARAEAAEDRAAVRDAAGQVEALLAQRAALETSVARLTSDTVPKSAQIVAQTRRAFDLGQAPLSDLLLAERAHRDLLQELLDTRFDLFNVRAQLRQQLGLDDQTARDASKSVPRSPS